MKLRVCALSLLIGAGGPVAAPSTAFADDDGNPPPLSQPMSGVYPENSGVMHMGGRQNVPPTYPQNGGRLHVGVEQNQSVPKHKGRGPLIPAER